MQFARPMLMAILSVSVLLSCQTTNPSTSVPQEPVIQTDPPGSPLQESTTQTLSPSFTQEDTAMTPVTPPDADSEKLVALVKQHLAQKLAISTDQIMLSDIKSVVWRDAGLGCPKPGVDYIQVETPGYNILLEANGKTYTYHTDLTRRFVPCMK